MLVLNLPFKADRKSGSAGMPRPISYAVYCLKKYTAYNKVQAKEAIDAAKKQVQEIEDLIWATRADSELSKINENAGQRPVKVSYDTFYVINFFFDDRPSTEIYTLSLHDALPISDNNTVGMGDAGIKSAIQG